MKKLLIVWHSQFGGTAQMAQAARAGAAEVDDVEVVFKRAQVVEEPLQIVETRKEPTPPAP